ncbi:hypothetical protein I4U23_028583 [Adineta vaga]|nr:hypothetical protein I4U23_028583 [Adineta vaga]
MVTTSFIVFVVFLGIVSSNNEKDTIRIINSGSSNTAGYVITVERSGRVTWNIAPRFHPTTSPAPRSTTARTHSSSSSTPSSTTTQNSIQLSVSRINSIFEAVQLAFPFKQYKPVFCVKSVSFGTMLHLQYKGEETPDLNCPRQEERLITLNKYVQGLITDLHINTFG